MSFIIFLVVAVLLFGVAKGYTEQKKRSSMEQDLLAAGADECYVSPIDWSFVGLSSASSRVIIGKQSLVRSYSFDQIVSAEVCTDGGTLTKTNRGSQVLGGVIGAAALGGVGVLAGALSGSTRSSSLVKELVLKVIVDDHQQPNYAVTFLCEKKGLKRDSFTVKQALERVDRLQARLVLAIRSGASTAIQAKATPRPNQPQLEQLWNLRVSGALTEEEFTSATRRLLAANSSEQS